MKFTRTVHIDGVPKQFTKDISDVNELAHWLQELTGGDSPIHSSAESQAQCQICNPPEKILP